MDLQPPWSWWWLIDTERFWMWMAVIMADQVFWQCADFDNPQDMCVSLTWVFSSLDPVLNWSCDKVDSLQGAQPSETETLTTFETWRYKNRCQWICVSVSDCEWLCNIIVSMEIFVILDVNDFELKILSIRQVEDKPQPECTWSRRPARKQ